ncbi:MAG: hypothetical protein HQM11_13340, partial [SAR324 cluster bacterium]|nr:hypothetical protein [SAR324 cluster bacterium]
MSEGTVNPSTLTLTANNFNAENLITVTGVDDHIKDGNVTYTVIISPASSLDLLYNGLDPDDVIVVNTDDETAGVTVVTTDATTTEAGDTGTFTVKLNSQPTADVTINITSGDTTEGTVSPATLTFTSANYAAPQTVTITGVNDYVADGNIAYSVTLSASSSDSNYQGIAISSVSLTNTDDDKISQQAYIKAVNNDSPDHFSESIAISGDTLVVGAQGESSNQTTITNGTTASSDNSNSGSGAVYVYKRTGTSWVQEAYIKAVNNDVSDHFGKSVAISGDTLVVGADYESSNQTTIYNSPQNLDSVLRYHPDNNPDSNGRRWKMTTRKTHSSSFKAKV